MSVKDSQTCAESSGQLAKAGHQLLPRAKTFKEEPILLPAQAGGTWVWLIKDPMEKRKGSFLDTGYPVSQAVSQLISSGSRQGVSAR